MTIVVNPYSQREAWIERLGAMLPDDELRLWPDTGDAATVEFAIAWRLPRATMHSFTNLRAVLSLSAGAEQWQQEGMPDVPIVRLADPAMSSEMAAYAVHWVMHHQRRFDVILEQQRQGIWDEPPSTPAWDYNVGVLGYGTIGMTIGHAFKQLGYQVSGWSRSGRSEPGVTHYAGAEQLVEFLGAVDAVVNVLPSTPETTKLLDRPRLAAMRPGSVLVNIGRGTVLDEFALVEALDGGPLGAAVLDVTDPEPPPADSPLWNHPGVVLTPHVAGRTRLETSSELVVANIARIRSGEEPFPLLDRSVGY